VLVACNSTSPSSSTRSAKWYDADAPVGVWLGTNVALVSKGPGQFAHELKILGFAVWPDGHLSLELPSTGLADFDRGDWERAVVTDPTVHGTPGTYKRDGDGWRITYNGGREATLKHVGDHLETEKAKLFRAKDVSGAKLDGLYTWWTNAEDSSLAGPGCQPLVTFTRDGHFEDRGGFATPCTSAPDPNAPGSGTYEIRDYSLVLSYADGRTVKHLITAPVNADLHTDNSRALITNRTWQRRAAPIAEAAAPTPPVPTAPVAASEDTTFDVVAFATPPGQAQRTKDMLIFTDASGDALRCMTAVYAGVPSTGDPERDFAADWKDIVLNGRTADATPSPQQGQNPHGLVFTAGGAMTTEPSGTRVFRALLVFEVGGRRVTVVLIAPTENQLASCHLEDLLQTMRAR
jgi:membrane-bound inhibitor of C-type lysozyme